MKASYACQNELPGDICINAETPEECLLLRIFANWPHYRQVILVVKNSGGNIGENKESILIGWRNEKKKICGYPEKEK
jgi:hypothetical protein